MLPDYAKEEILIRGWEQRSRLADVRTRKKSKNLSDRLTLKSMISVNLTAFFS